MYCPFHCVNFQFPQYIFVKVSFVSEFSVSSVSIAGISFFRIGLVFVIGTGVASELSDQLVQNQFLRQWKEMTQFLKLQCCLKLPRFLQQQNQNWFFLSMDSCSIYLDIFAEPEYSPLLSVAEWYRFNLFCDFDTSRSDLYINIDGA